MPVLYASVYPAASAKPVGRARLDGPRTMQRVVAGTFSLAVTSPTFDPLAPTTRFVTQVGPSPRRPGAPWNSLATRAVSDNASDSYHNTKHRQTVSGSPWKVSRRSVSKSGSAWHRDGRRIVFAGLWSKESVGLHVLGKSLGGLAEADSVLQWAQVQWCCVGVVWVVHCSGREVGFSGACADKTRQRLRTKTASCPLNTEAPGNSRGFYGSATAQHLLQK